MARENKLQIRIEASAEKFQQALKKVEADVKKSTSTISESFKKSGDGVEALVNTIDLVEQAFDESGDAGKKALESISDSSSKAGKDLRDAFVKGGQSIEEAEKEAQEFVKAIEQFSDAKKEADNLEKSLKEVKNELDKTGDAAKAINFQTALESARDLAEGLKNISSSFTSTAEESRKMERAIKAAISKPEQAEEMIAAAKAIKDEYGDLVSEEDIGQAIKRLDTLQAASKDNLEAIAKLAVDSGKDLEDAADDLGEILAPLESGIADLDLLGESFRANFGVGVEVLRQYGAEVDSNGKIVAATREEQQKAQEAVRRYLKENERFKGIADRNKDAQARLSDEFDKFQRSIGESINELKNFVSEALLPLVKSFNDLSPGIKKTIAGAVVLAPAIASVAVAGTQAVTAFNFIKASSLGAAVANSRLAAAAGTAATSMSGAATAAAALNVGVLGFAGVAAAALVAVVAIKNATDGWIESLEQADKANEKLINTETRFIQKNKDIFKIRKQSIDQLREQAEQEEDLGKRRAFATKVVEDAVLALRDAERTGGDTKDAERRLKDARALRREVDIAIKAEADSQKVVQKATEDRFRAARDAYIAFKKEFDRGTFDSQEKALNSLKAIATGLEGESLKEAQADIRKLNQAILGEKLARLQKEVDAEKVSIERAKEIQGQLLGTYKANADERRKAAESLKDAEDKINKKRLENEQKLEAEKLNLAKSAIQQRLALAQDNPELASLQKRLAAGEDVIDQIKREEQAQAAKIKGLIDEAAELDRIAIKRQQAADIKADPRNESAIAEQAAEKLRQLNVSVAAEKSKLDRAVFEKQVELDQKRADLKKQRDKETADAELKLAEIALQRYDLEKQAATEAFELRRQQLDEEAALGVDVTNRRQQLDQEIAAARKKALEEEFQREVDIITAKREAANAGANETQQKVNNAQAELDIEKAKQKVKAETKAIDSEELTKAKEKTAEIQQQIKEQKKLNEEKKKGFQIESSFGNVTQGIEGLNEFGGGFGQSRFKNRSEDGEEAESGPSLGDLKRQETQAKIEETKAREKAKREAEAAAGTPQGATPQNVTRGEPGLTPSQIPQDSLLAQQQNQTQQQQLAEQRKTNALLQQLATRPPSAENAGSRFAEGGTRLPGNPL